jgi:hypothetical protein
LQGPVGPQGPEGDIGATGATGPQGPPGQGVLFGHLIVIIHVTGNIHGGTGGATASDFIIHVSGNHQSPDTFPGSETGTDVTLGFGSYQVLIARKIQTNSPTPQMHHTMSNIAQTAQVSYTRVKQRDVQVLPNSIRGSCEQAQIIFEEYIFAFNRYSCDGVFYYYFLIFYHLGRSLFLVFLVTREALGCRFLFIDTSDIKLTIRHIVLKDLDTRISY